LGKIIRVELEPMVLVVREPRLKTFFGY